MTRPLHFPDRVKDPITERRIDNLEARSLTRPQTTNPVTVADTGVFRILWSIDGTVGEGSSNVWPFFTGDAANLGLFWATIASTTTTDTDLEVRRSGIAVATLTLVAGTGVQSLVYLSESYADGDFYTVAVTAAGAGAEDLQTIARFTT